MRLNIQSILRLPSLFIWDSPALFNSSLIDLYPADLWLVDVIPNDVLQTQTWLVKSVFTRVFPCFAWIVSQVTSGPLVSLSLLFLSPAWVVNIYRHAAILLLFLLSYNLSQFYIVSQVVYTEPEGYFDPADPNNYFHLYNLAAQMVTNAFTGHLLLAQPIWRFPHYGILVIWTFLFGTTNYYTKTLVATLHLVLTLSAFFSWLLYMVEEFGVFCQYFYRQVLLFWSHSVSAGGPLRTLVIFCLPFFSRTYFYTFVYYFLGSTAVNLASLAVAAQGGSMAAVVAGSWRDLVALVTVACAQTCSSLPGILGFSCATGYMGRLISVASRHWLHGADVAFEHHENLLIGLLEGFIAFIFAIQCDLLGGQGGEKAFTVGMIIFIMISAFLTQVCNEGEEALLKLAASQSVSVARHLRVVSLNLAILSLSSLMAYKLYTLFEMDIWLLIAVGGCVVTVVQVVDAFLCYALILFDNHCREPWDNLDDAVYAIRNFCRVLDFLGAILVLYSCGKDVVHGDYDVLGMLLIVVHIYVNIWDRAVSGWRSVKNRWSSVTTIRLLRPATLAELRELDDICAICYQAMFSARITPCRHFFHAVCLRKWLYVRHKCPLCHKAIQLSGPPADPIRQNLQWNPGNVGRPELEPNQGGDGDPNWQWNPGNVGRPGLEPNQGGGGDPNWQRNPGNVGRPGLEPNQGGDGGVMEPLQPDEDIDVIG